MISHHPAKFDGHRQCGSREIMFLVVAWQDSSALAYSRAPPPPPLSPHYCLSLSIPHDLKTQNISC